GPFYQRYAVFAANILKASCAKRSDEAAMLKHEMGVLAATTAFGKTVVAAWLIAQRGINTLVLVHRKRFSIVGWKRCARHEDGSSRMRTCRYRLTASAE